MDFDFRRKAAWLAFLTDNNIVENLADYEAQFPNPYFDIEYYCARVGCDQDQAIEHFLTQGEIQGIPPCQSLEAYCDNIKTEQSEPLAWFNEFLQRATRLALLDYETLSDMQKVFEVFSSQLFDPSWYVDYYADIREHKINPVLHFAMYGLEEGRQPNAFFQEEFVRTELGLSDLDNPFLSYVANENPSLSASFLFDAEHYLATYQDVEEVGMNPMAHYLNYGRHEGRVYVSSLEQSKLLLPEWYLNFYEDLRCSTINPFEHYVLHGELEGRRPNPYFDPAWYAKRYEVDQKGALAHYENEGWKFQYWPSEGFNAEAYIEQYQLDDNTNPLEHFLVYGKRQGLTLPAVTPSATAIEGRREITLNPEAQIIESADFRGFIDNAVVSCAPSNLRYAKNQLNIHWVIPDFSAGGGGHMSIFRTIRWLEIFGHKNTIWVYNPSGSRTEQEAYDDILKHFQQVLAEVKFVDERFYELEGDAIFATGWGSVSYVNAVANVKKRFYFVQDYEAEFYAMGAQKILAESTYEGEIDCICASPWLAQKMREKYGLWSNHFYLAVDQHVYFSDRQPKAENAPFKIAFYARSFTERRCVELGWLALEKLAQLGVDFEVHAFGAPAHFSEAPFKMVDHGVVSPEDLATIFNECDLGMVFSGTNYSLTPQEMMACELPVAELDGESTRAIFPEGVVEFMSPMPAAMAQQLKQLIEQPERLEQLKTNASQWVSNFCWEEAARIVENSVLERLMDAGFEANEVVRPQGIKASVIIPTYNGGAAFEAVLPKLMAQKTPWNFEVIIVDSGSKDGTLELIAQYPEVKLFKIDSKNFQHGRTRNYAIEQTSGEFVAVLTHDALPATDYWLHDLVSLLEKYPNAAGAFGRHFAYPDADPYTKNDLTGHFKGFDAHPVVVSRYLDEEKFENDLGWRQFLHFYSDNNSCMRKSVWEKHPYPEVNFGEDQAWADLIIEQGYEKVYSKAASVYHSHDFDPEETEIRAFEESEFFFGYFGYKMVDVNAIDPLITALQKEAQQYGQRQGLPEEVISLQLRRIDAKIRGFARAIDES